MAIFVYPRWPSAAILDFIEPQIAPFDPSSPKKENWTFYFSRNHNNRHEQTNERTNQQTNKD